VQLSQHQGLVLGHVVVGVAPELATSRPRQALPATVLLPRVAGVVVAVAVELHGEAVVGSAAVDVAAVGDPIGDREGQPLGLEEGQEGSLEVAEPDALLLERLAEAASSRYVWSSGEHCEHGARLYPVANLGLVARPRQILEGDRPAMSTRVRGMVVIGMSR
jgi:hypothetical protein